MNGFDIGLTTSDLRACLSLVVLDRCRIRIGSLDGGSPAGGGVSGSRTGAGGGSLSGGRGRGSGLDGSGRMGSLGGVGGSG